MSEPTVVSLCWCVNANKTANQLTVIFVKGINVWHAIARHQLPIIPTSFFFILFIFLFVRQRKIYHSNATLLRTFFLPVFRLSHWTHCGSGLLFGLFVHSSDYSCHLLADYTFHVNNVERLAYTHKHTHTIGRRVTVYKSELNMLQKVIDIICGGPTQPANAIFSSRAKEQKK